MAGRIVPFIWSVRVGEKCALRSGGRCGYRGNSSSIGERAALLFDSPAGNVKSFILLSINPGFHLYSRLRICGDPPERSRAMRFIALFSKKANACSSGYSRSGFQQGFSSQVESMARNEAARNCLWVRRIQPNRLSIRRQTNPSIRLWHRRANRGSLDLIPEFRVGGRLYLEPMVVGALPGADHFT
jgi:hypothetical protein